MPPKKAAPNKKRAADKPWILVGTGPTFAVPDPEKWQILALNRALNHVDADVLALSHRVTLNALNRDKLQGITVIVGDPFITDPGLESIRHYPPVRNLMEHCRLEVYRRFDHKPISVEQLQSALPQYGTVATFAIAWLRRNGVKQFYSVGIDGGSRWHEDIQEDYKKLPDAFSRNYEKAFNCTSEVVRALGMEWKRLTPQQLEEMQGEKVAKVEKT